MTASRSSCGPALLGVLLLLAATACRGDAGRTTARPAPAAPSSEAELEPSPSQTDTAAAAFPPASTTVEHGRQLWAVYLALSRLDASGQPEQPEELRQAEQRAAAVGYEGDVGTGDVGCDQGAREALRLDPARDYQAVSLFFDTQAQAQQFVDAFEPPVVGTARITAFCLD